MSDLVEAIRTADAADVEALTRLQNDARAGLVGTRGGDALLEEFPAVDWQGVLDEPSSAVFVASLDGVVLGYLELARGPVAVIRQVFVDPEARELGLGDGLVEAARVLAAAEGSARLEATALPGDRETKNLFERAGIVARKIIVSTRLSER